VGPTKAELGETVLASQETALANETVLAVPGNRAWMSVVLALIWAAVGWAYWPDIAPMALWLGFSTVGLYLAAVDLDVRRLPNRAQLLLAGICALGGVWAYWGQGRFVWGLVWALACAGGFLVVHLLSRGGLGFGDVKLMASCGWILGLNSSTAVLVAMMIGCLVAVVFSILTRTRVFAFGPWLLLGTFCGPIAATYLITQ
jgi:prepilin signal peptidase PulO-like enzyme (type II secretory pathway)